MRTLRHASVRTEQILSSTLVKIHPLQAVMQTFGSAPCRVTARLLPCRLPWQFVPSLTALQLCAKYACWYKQSQIQNIKDKLAKMDVRTGWKMTRKAANVDDTECMFFTWRNRETKEIKLILLLSHRFKRTGCSSG